MEAALLKRTVSDLRGFCLTVSDCSTELRLARETLHQRRESPPQPKPGGRKRNDL
jgi:hypothetical protein